MTGAQAIILDHEDSTERYQATKSIAQAIGMVAGI